MSSAVEAQHLIGGRWEGEPTLERRNPADPSQVVSIASVAGEAELATAITEAEHAATAWGQMPAPARGTVLTNAAGILSSRRDEVALHLCEEEGKTLAEATGEVARAVEILRFFGSEGWRLGGRTLPASAPDTLLYTVKQPLGVVAVITPWNFPIAIPTWKIAPALVSGNAVVLKPAALTPLTANALAAALVDAGLPPGVLSVIHGSGGVVGDALVRHPSIRAISFTGSTSVGRQIALSAAERLARAQLEMGGKNALIVLDDADPVAAARIAAQGGWGLTGQACTATSRVICTAAAHDAFVDALSTESRSWQPGNGQSPEVRMGPVVSGSQLETDLGYLDLARDEGAEVVVGGTHEALMVAPVVLAGVRPDMRVAQEEIFGPVIAVLKAADVDQAIEVANDSDYGLTAGIVTNDLSAAMKFADRIEAGVVKVNRATTGLELNAPFGGTKLSSSGTFKEQGQTAVDFYTQVKTVYLGT